MKLICEGREEVEHFLLVPGVLQCDGGRSVISVCVPQQCEFSCAFLM